MWSANAVLGRRFGRRLCEALGINSDAVTHITLRANANGEAWVELRRVVQEEDVDRLISVLETYDMAPISRDGLGDG